MALRKILVPVDGSDAALAALKTAFAIGRAHGSHVEALHVRASPSDAVPLLGEGMSGAMIDELIEVAAREANARAVAARQVFSDVREELGIPQADAPADGEASAAFVEIVGREDEVVAVRGRLTDLIVVSRPSAGADVTANLTLSAALFESGRPVLVAAAEPRPVLGRRIAVAWNNSVEATRALVSAMPFLKAADHVWVVSADREEEGVPLCGDAADYLSWHGIHAEKRLVLGRGAIGEALLDGCAEADMVVMGAYTHSRLRELIFGGVTRYMLEEATLPLLMAH